MKAGLYASVLCSLLALAGLLGCNSQQTQSMEPAPQLSADLPGPANLRNIAGLREDFLLGADAASSAAAVANGSALQLLASGNQPAWALYAFDPQGRSLDSLAVMLDAQDGAAAWILLADFAAGRWEWHGPYNSSRTIALDEQRYVSPSGAAVFAVAGSGNGMVTVSALSIRSQATQNLPPSAQLQADLPGGEVPLSVQFDASASADADGSIIEYAWDWDGDGGYDTFSESPQLSHTFTGPGLVQVRLRVSDDSFQRAYDTASLNLLQPGNAPPQAEVSCNPAAADVPAQVTLDASASTAGGDAGDSLVLFEWDFDGDGAFDAYGPSPQLSHTYAQPGAVMVIVRVTDSAGNQAEDSVTLELNSPGNAAPQALLDPPDAQGALPLSVSFDAGGSTAGGDLGDSIVLYEWDLDGDGLWESYGSQESRVYTYTSPAALLARVRVTDSAGNQAVASSAIDAYLASNNPPQAQLDCNSSSGYAPLNVDFDASASDAGGDSGDSLVLYEWDWDGDGAFEAYGTAAGISHVYTTPGSYLAQLRVTDSAGNQDVDSLAIEVQALNQAPQAVLQASASECNAGDVLEFFASSSYDSDGSIIKYEWDLDGNGSFETDSGTLDHVSQGYNSPGPPFSVRLRVRDDDGYFGTDELALTVHGWVTLTLESSGLTGAYCRQALIGGKPAICFQQANSTDLKYAVSATDSGSSLGDWTIVTVDNAVDGGQYGSVCEVNGKPAISYYDGGLSDLKFACSSTASGASAADWTCMTLDSAGGQSSSLCVVAGNPAIAHYDSVSQDLRYRRSTTVSGASASDWSQSVVIDSAGSVGNHCSLAVVNGVPAISYADSDNGDLKYAFSSTSTGAQAADWSNLVVDNTGGGQYSSLTLVGGKPAISYYNFGNEKLMYAISSTAGGSLAGDWTFVTVDSSTTCGSYSSLAQLSGNPAISYWDYANGDLQLARSITATGSSPYDWTQLQRADGDGTASGPNVGKYSSMVVIGGRPQIAYQDAGNSDLKYAVRY